MCVDGQETVGQFAFAFPNDFVPALAAEVLRYEFLVLGIQTDALKMKPVFTPIASDHQPACVWLFAYTKQLTHCLGGGGGREAFGEGAVTMY